MRLWISECESPEAALAKRNEILLRIPIADLSSFPVIAALICSLSIAKTRPLRPSGRRRTTTPSWPWNIKTSLIVLWGVCWMFHPRPSFTDNVQWNFNVDELFLDSQATETGQDFGMLDCS